MKETFPLFPEQASTIAPSIDALYFFLIAVTVFFTGLIFSVIIYFMVKYRRRSDADPIPPRLHADPRLEILWTVVPLAIAMVIFVWAASLFVTISKPPEDALEIFVVGRQWMWKFQHPDGQQEINELHVPLGRPVRLIMATQDVIHSLFIPAFRVKQDVIPGRYTILWFEATRPGTYHLFCAEYCGTLHAGMIGRVVVLEPRQYESWLTEMLEAPGGATVRPEGSLAAQGERLFERLGCEACHRPHVQGIGPALAGVFGSEVRLHDGRTVKADESYLRESILNPQAKIVAGFQPVMPSYQGRVREDEIQQLVAYIKSLGREGKMESAGR